MEEVEGEPLTKICQLLNPDGKSQPWWDTVCIVAYRISDSDFSVYLLRKWITQEPLLLFVRQRFSVRCPAIFKANLQRLGQPMSKPCRKNNGACKHASSLARNCHPVQSSVDRAGWQAKMASTEVGIPWCNAHGPRWPWNRLIRSPIPLHEWNELALLKLKKRTRRSNQRRRTDTMLQFCSFAQLISSSVFGCWFVWKFSAQAVEI